MRKRLRKKFRVGEFQEYGFRLLILSSKDIGDYYWQELVPVIEKYGCQVSGCSTQHGADFWIQSFREKGTRLTIGQFYNVSLCMFNLSKIIRSNNDIISHKMIGIVPDKELFNIMIQHEPVYGELPWMKSKSSAG